jgi:phosphoglycerol transferase MdoB-like AlkP superfamily enzyme
MQGFLMSNGMMRIYSVFDYASDEKLSTLGVPDHVMFDHAVEFIKSNHAGKRFFATLLTASNHGPWKIPDVPFDRVSASDGRADPLNAFKYSDWALGHFVRKIENDPAFAHTLIIVTGDNGTLVNPVHDPDLSQYEIPILIYDTDHRIGSGKRINRLGSQVDILATVMGLLQLNYDDQSFGSDLLDTSTVGADVTNFALMSEGYTVGYVENGYYLVSRLGGKPSLYSLAADSLDLADSLKLLAANFDRRALSFFQTAYFNLKRPLSR